MLDQFEKNAQVKLMNYSIKYFNFIVNDTAKNIRIYTYADTVNKSELSYWEDSTSLILTGKINTDSVFMRLQKYDINKFRQVSRGYHWVNEFPYNR